MTTPQKYARFSKLHFINQQHLTFSYDGNPGLHSMRQHERNLKFIVVTVTGAFAVILLLVGCLWLLRNHQKKLLQGESQEKSM